MAAFRNPTKDLSLATLTGITTLLFCELNILTRLGEVIG
jgi:hypothetical protein